MLDIFQQVIDSLFPPLEAVRLLRGIKPADILKHYSPHYFGSTLALSSYHEPIIKAAITANKFHNYEEAAMLLSHLMNIWVANTPPRPTVFVPIPLSKKRQQERGYNQVEQILKASQTSDLKPLPIAILLSRTVHTQPQTSLHRTERLANMQNAFKATVPDHFPYTRVVIVDDVVTTGATMEAARKTLRHALPQNVELITLALAH